MVGRPKLICFGTPDFAVPTLKMLCESGRSPAMVISQPSRRAGRGRKLSEPPVVEFAHSIGLEVRQPEKVSSPTLYDELAALSPVVAVVVAFGQIFRQPLLDLPELGCINLHASLLPKYRGAAPIQAALANGDSTTGVTTMFMERGLDSGPILMQRETTISPQETAEDLSATLAHIGGELVLKTLSALESDRLVATPQNDETATYAPRLDRKDGDLDWTLTAEELSNRIRAFVPWPGSRGRIGEQLVKVQRASPVERQTTEDLEAGAVLGLYEDLLLVQCGQGTVLGLEVVQVPGRKPIAAAEFWRSRELEIGEQ